MTCASCRAEVPEGAKFCPSCGSRLGSVCPECGAAVRADQRFCTECGTAQSPEHEAAPPALSGGPAAARDAPPAELRHVSVLFADLVGSTGLAEQRDPEEVRELLSRYYERCRTVVARYGGTVEKFIGDAVMAVWGAPITREDDAERAVRAALELMPGIPALGAELGVSDLRARGAVVTGQAAITLAAEGQGMVAGDLVTTASRVQSIAAPGEIWVDEGTRKATSRAIASEDVGV
ncbi:MAG TPA: adenylate/guanylate cyclase domain-containing protein, partial [Solirubrobacteraceae bacterium]